MKRFFLLLVFFSFPAFADIIGKGQVAESLNICKSSRNGRLAVVTNTDNGSDPYQVVCKDNTGLGGWEWVRVGGSGDVVSAGDEDGQTIQGLTGNNKARIELSLEGEVDKAALIGGGATYGFIYAYADGVYGASPDESTSFDLYNGGLDLTTNGAVQLYGDTSTNLGRATGRTTVNGSIVNVTSLQTPHTNANDPCTAGDTIDTATYHYYCAATDTWVRVAMATWP